MLVGSLAGQEKEGQALAGAGGLHRRPADTLEGFQPRGMPSRPKRSSRALRVSSSMSEGRLRDRRSHSSPPGAAVTTEVGRGKGDVGADALTREAVAIPAD